MASTTTTATQLFPSFWPWIWSRMQLFSGASWAITLPPQHAAIAVVRSPSTQGNKCSKASKGVCDLTPNAEDLPRGRPYDTKWRHWILFLDRCPPQPLAKHALRTCPWRWRDDDHDDDDGPAAVSLRQPRYHKLWSLPLWTLERSSYRPLLHLPAIDAGVSYQYHWPEDRSGLHPYKDFINGKLRNVQNTEYKFKTRKRRRKNETQNEDYNRFGSISQKLMSLCRRLLEASPRAFLNLTL